MLEYTIRNDEVDTMKPAVLVEQNHYDFTGGAGTQDLKDAVPASTKGGPASVTFIILNDGSGDAYITLNNSSTTPTGTKIPAFSEREIGPLYLPFADDQYTIDAEVNADLYVDSYLHGNF